jgi:hypothetical protein
MVMRTSGSQSSSSLRLQVQRDNEWMIMKAWALFEQSVQVVYTNNHSKWQMPQPQTELISLKYNK